MRRTYIILGLLAMICLAVGARKKPLLVGITDANTKGSAGVSRTYINAVRRAGNVAVIIPLSTDSATIAEALKQVDALVIPGGEDVNPDWYGAAHSPKLGGLAEVRDTFEIMLLRQAVRRKIPILGVCRGLQVINVCFGGTLYQDLPSERPESTIHHLQDASQTVGTHRVYLDPSTHFGKTMGVDTMRVNSFHHQAVRDLAPGFRVTARATDGVIEGIECPKLHITAVQFHPEGMAIGDDVLNTRIYRDFFGK